MANLSKSKLLDESRIRRQNRFFSEDFRRGKVKELEQGIITIAEISREYEVSRTSIYKWIYKYSMLRKKQVKQVVESQSDTRKIKELKNKIFTYGFTTKKGGKGFGLHYCANYIQSIGGSIRAESEGPGKGAEFLITIPVQT